MLYNERKVSGIKVDQEVSLDEQGNLVVEVNGQKHLLSALNPSFNTKVIYQKVGKVIPVAEDGFIAN